MKTYRMNVKQIDEHTFIQAEVPQSIVDEIRADAIDDIVKLIKNTDSNEFAMFSLGFIEEISDKLKGVTNDTGN